MNAGEALLQLGIAGATLFVMYKLGRGVLALITGALDRNTRAITRVEAKLDADRVGRAPTEPGSDPSPDPSSEREA